MNIKEIVIKHLQDFSFAGIVNPMLNCNCDIKSLMVCNNNCSECEPGYKYKCSQCNIAYFISDETEPEMTFCPNCNAPGKAFE